MQNVILAFPQLDIASSDIATARMAFEDVFVRCGLDVSIEEAAGSEESARAAFLILDKLGLLVVGNDLQQLED